MLQTLSPNRGWWRVVCAMQIGEQIGSGLTVRRGLELKSKQREMGTKSHVCSQ